jgi:serine/threonine protein kinase
MSSTKVACPKCSYRLFFSDTLQLTEQKCSECETSFTIPKKTTTHLLQKHYSNDDFSNTYIAHNNKGDAILLQIFSSTVSKKPIHCELLQSCVSRIQNTNQLPSTEILTFSNEGSESYIEFNFHKSSLKKTLSSNSLNTHEKLKLIEQLASNLKQLHSQGFIHGNLKPSNIKLSSSKILFHDIEISWKIASALHIKNCDIEPINNVNYAAPETLDHLALTKESNIYSLGIIIWELFNHEPAFPNASTVSAKLKVVGNKPPDHGLEQITQSKLKCLFLKTLSTEPQMRPSLEEIMHACQSATYIASCLSTTEDERPILVNEAVASAAPSEGLSLLLDPVNSKAAKKSLIDLISDPESNTKKPQSRKSPTKHTAKPKLVDRELNDQIRRSARRIKIFFLLLNILIFGSAISYMFFYNETKAFINSTFGKDLLPSKKPTRSTIN